MAHQPSEIDTPRSTDDIENALSAHLIRENERIEDELLQARAVQRYLLPPELFTHKNVRTSFVYHPLHHVGGDFLDMQVLADDTIMAMVGDVSGHGIAAALSSATLKTAFMRHASLATGPGDLLTRVDRELGNTIRFGRFATAMAFTFNVHTRELRLSSAGHPHPLFLRGGNVSRLEFETELPLFTGESVTYPDALVMTLDIGDRVVLMTDGILEAVKGSGDMMTAEELNAMVGPGAIGEHFTQGIFEALFFSDLVFNDDVSLFGLEVLERRQKNESKSNTAEQ